MASPGESAAEQLAGLYTVSLQEVSISFAEASSDDLYSVSCEAKLCISLPRKPCGNANISCISRALLSFLATEVWQLKRSEATTSLWSHVELESSPESGSEDVKLRHACAGCDRVTELWSIWIHLGLVMSCEVLWFSFSHFIFYSIVQIKAVNLSCRRAEQIHYWGLAKELGNDLSMQKQSKQDHAHVEKCLFWQFVGLRDQRAFRTILSCFLDVSGCLWLDYRLREHQSGAGWQSSSIIQAGQGHARVHVERAYFTLKPPTGEWLVRSTEHSRSYGISMWLCPNS